MTVKLNTISLRPCRICGITGNPIVATERPCALWGNKPWMPEGHYTLIRCRICGNLYVDSDVTERYLDELMGSFLPELENSVTYVPNVEGEKIRTAELALNWKIIISFRRPNSKDKLLDYGCAWGAFGNIAKQTGCIPNGIELQPAAAAESLKLWGEESVLHIGSIETSPFKKNEFQYITAFETLEHVFDPVRILKEMKSLLKDDGVCAISVPSADYFTFKFWLYRKQPYNDYMRRKLPFNMQEGRVLIHNHINTFSLTSAKLMMEKSGFKVIYISPLWGKGRGLLNYIFTISGKLLWLISFKKIAFAPSIFIVAK